MRCNQVDSWQAPSNSFRPRNALRYADCTTSYASSSFRVNRRATARRRPPKRRTIISKAHSCPARRAATSACSSTVTVHGVTAFAQVQGVDRFERRRQPACNLVIIGHLFQLLRNEQRTVRQQDALSCSEDATARRRSHRRTRRRPDRARAGAGEAVLTDGLVAHTTEFFNPRTLDLPFEAENLPSFRPRSPRRRFSASSFGRRPGNPCAARPGAIETYPVVYQRVAGIAANSRRAGELRNIVASSRSGSRALRTPKYRSLAARGAIR